ncbi:MAG: membrane protein insertion efficiency factor YidD [Acidobacteriota bacterium]|nr:membrane protein insertion efficiency factor YidD [Acidobacteriota bacterium]
MWILRLYQVAVSPYLPSACRFMPSCSEYSRQAFEIYSIPRAAWVTARRLLRCHPLTRGGYDPVK